MATRKPYGQFCALARALDHVGDRWTLLVVRELLLGPRTFKELDGALPGLSSALLVQRLRSLEEDGLVARNAAPVRSKAVTYELTEAGAALEPAVLDLIRWGARWMTTGPGSDAVDPRWAALALKALLATPLPRARRGSVHLEVGGLDLAVSLEGRRRGVVPGRPERARAKVTATMPDVLAVAAGLTPMADSPLSVEGDHALAVAALEPAP